MKKYYQRPGKHGESFASLGYTFAPQNIKSKYETQATVLTFSASICTAVKVHIRKKIKGWGFYFSKFNRNNVLQFFYYLNELICKWIRNTYRLRSTTKVVAKYKQIVKFSHELFYHWKLGVTY